MLSFIRTVQNLFVLAVIAGCLCGCASNTKPYTKTGGAQLTFRIKQFETGFMESGSASLNIFKGPDRCSLEYQGTVALTEDSEQKVDLPYNEPAYLRLWVVKGSTTRTFEFYFIPEKKYAYTLEYLEKKSAFGKKLSKRNVITGKESELSVFNWQICDR